jgi:hypothetical protein
MHLQISCGWFLGSKVLLADSRATHQINEIHLAIGNAVIDKCLYL